MRIAVEVIRKGERGEFADDYELEGSRAEILADLKQWERNSLYPAARVNVREGLTEAEAQELFFTRKDALPAHERVKVEGARAAVKSHPGAYDLT